MKDTNTDAAPVTRAVDAEHRRWLIGVAISVAFGTFGAVMAWLSYSARIKPPVPSSGQVAKPASSESDRANWQPRRRKSSEPR